MFKLKSAADYTYLTGRQRVEADALEALSTYEIFPGVPTNSYKRFLDALDKLGPFEKFVAELRMQGLTDTGITRILTDFYTDIAWARAGLNVFTLTEGLAHKLLLTEPSEQFSFHDTPFPFPSFKIILPAGVIPVFGKNSDETPDSGEEVTRRWATYLSVNRMDMHVSELGRLSGEEVPYIDYHIHGPGFDVNRRSTFDEIARYAPLPQDVKHFDDESKNIPRKEEDSITSDTALRLIKNFLCWLEMTGGTASRSPVSRPSVKKGKRAPGPLKPTSWVLGQEVKITDQLKQLSQELALGQMGRGPKGWKVRVQFVVRGHWRNQVCGKGRLERRRTWVEPYWKGPEGAEAWSHIYE